MILDLAKHKFERAHELYGDRWLGFAESDLQRWLEAVSRYRGTTSGGLSRAGGRQGALVLARPGVLRDLQRQLAEHRIRPREPRA